MRIYGLTEDSLGERFRCSERTETDMVVLSLGCLHVNDVFPVEVAADVPVAAVRGL